VKQTDIKKLTKEMEKIQDKKRYQHSIGVAYTAISLAMRYEVDLKDAQIAGLLHDCAKCISDDKKFALCKKYNVSLTEFEKKNPFLIHAKLGGCLAAKKYGITNPDIIAAIEHHTTGRPNMSTLEKIIFIADYIEPWRKPLPQLDAIRKMAFVDLDKTMCMILKSVLDYLETTGREIDETTQITYDFYRRCEEEV